LSLGFCLPIFSRLVERDAKFILRIVVKILPDELRVKAIESSGDRGMCRKDISSPRNGQSQIERLCMILHIAVRPFEHCKRCMAFIEMADFGLQTKRPQQAPSANPENDLLLQPHLRIAAIEFARYSAMSRCVCEIICVEQVKLCPANRDLPAAEPDQCSRQVDLQPQPLSVLLPQRPDGQLARIIDRIECLLPAFRIEVLAEISLTIEQSNSNDWNTQVAGRLHLISRYISKPT
jgi:hypothetical protein